MYEVSLQPQRTTIIELTLLNPWATLLMCGQKRYDICVLPPPISFIGQRVAIRAARPRPFEHLPATVASTVDKTLAACGITELQSGLLGSAVLRGAWRLTRGVSRHLTVAVDAEVDGSTPSSLKSITLTPREAMFGDLRAGRWLWFYDDPVLSVALGAGGDAAWQLGMVKWFSPRKRYGFITRGIGLEDVFVRAETLEAAGLTTLEAGQGVQFCAALSAKGLTAASIKLITAQNEMGAIAA